MSELDNLRPEVREAINRQDRQKKCDEYCPVCEDRATIRAELLRLTDENARLLAANRDAMDHFEQMKAELTIAHHERDRMFLDAREWATRFGEMEARAEKAEAELAALKARVAEAPIIHAEKTWRGTLFVNLSQHDVDLLDGKRVRLVVEE